MNKEWLVVIDALYDEYVQVLVTAPDAEGAAQAALEAYDQSPYRWVTPQCYFVVPVEEMRGVVQKFFLR